MMENEWRMVEIDGRKYRERAMATTSPSGGAVKNRSSPPDFDGRRMDTA